MYFDSYGIIGELNNTFEFLFLYRQAIFPVLEEFFQIRPYLYHFREGAISQTIS